MSIKRLDALFQPRSVAVIGASEKPDSLGTFVMRNLLGGEFGGPVMPVNPKYESVLGVLCYDTVGALPRVPSLGVICTPPATVPAVLRELGELGTRTAVVMAASPAEPAAGLAQEFRQQIREAAAPSGIRVLGPASTGLQVPGIGLNASWIRSRALPGKLALVSQSGSVAAGVVEWANSHGVGFSHIVSTGMSVDIDVGDVLDLLAMQINTKAVLLYLRRITDSRKFLSAARALARIKPVIAIKANRFLGGANAHEMADNLHDGVYDAAIRRAGVLRVHNTDELFDAAETLTHAQNLRGERLAIVCNGSGPGEMAADTLLAGGGRLSALSPEVVEALQLPRGLGLRNPLDIGRDATAERYRDVVSALLKDPDVDAVLIMHTPTSVSSAEDVAREVAATARKTTRNVLACWLGENERQSVRAIFAEAKIPLYVSPDKAAGAFLHLVHYRRNQEMLLETPSTPPPSHAARRDIARSAIGDLLASQQDCLDEVQSARVLAAYGITSPESAMGNDAEDAVRRAEQLGYPVTLRLCSPTVQRRFAVGNMSFDLGSADAVRTAATGILRLFDERYPDAIRPGIVVQRMVRRAEPVVLMAGIVDDPLFGRVIQFGAGGVGCNVRSSPVAALPPLNMSLARELVARAGVAEMLALCDATGTSERAVCSTLVQLSELALDFPEIHHLEINPLLADAEGTLALDARIGIAPWAPGQAHLAIRPYPSELEETLTLRDGSKVLVRPIRPEDEPAYKELLTRLSPQDLRLRFHAVTTVPRSLLAQLIHIDYDREMAFVAAPADAGYHPELLGVVDIAPARGANEAEFGIVVSSELKGMGLGRSLMEKIIRYSHDRGFDSLYGLVLPENDGMLNLARRLGMRHTPIPEDEVVKVELALGAAARWA